VGQLGSCFDSIPCTVVVSYSFVLFLNNFAKKYAVYSVKVLENYGVNRNDCNFKVRLSFFVRFLNRVIYLLRSCQTFVNALL